MSISVEGMTFGKPEQTRFQQASPTLPVTRQIKGERWTDSPSRFLRSTCRRWRPVPNRRSALLLVVCNIRPWPAVSTPTPAPTPTTMPMPIQKRYTTPQRIMSKEARYGFIEIEISTQRPSTTQEATCRRTDLDDLDPVRRVPRRTPEFHLETPGVVFDGR